MSCLQVITMNETEKWDSIVKSFNNYDVTYLSKYSKAFQIQGEGEPLLFYYNCDGTRAINVAMKRDISNTELFREKLPSNTWFDLSTPYGYGGVLVEGEDYDKFNEVYDTYCKESGFVSEFVRFHLFNDFQSYYSGCIETPTRNVVRDLDLSIDEMLMDFEHKVRKNLKKALKAGLEVEIDASGERLNEFLNIYYGTMNRTNAKKNFFFTEDFFKALSEMTDNYVYIHILYEQKVISTELVLYGTENCYSFLGGTDRDYFNLRPNDFLKFEIIKWAKGKGLKKFVLGGGYGSDDGIFKYKKSFAPNGVCNFYIGKKIFNREKYDELVQLCLFQNEYNCNSTFFPAYRR